MGALQKINIWWGGVRLGGIASKEEERGYGLFADLT